MAKLSEVHHFHGLNKTLQIIKTFAAKFYFHSHACQMLVYCVVELFYNHYHAKNEYKLISHFIK